MRVDLQDRQPLELGGGRRHERRRDRMLAAKADEELPARENFRRDARDFVHQWRHLAKWQLHRGKREDADAVDVSADLLVPQLHV